MSPAEFCLVNRIEAGDVVVGKDPDVDRWDAWLITAIGETHVLKRSLAFRRRGTWERVEYGEGLCEFDFRTWQKASKEELRLIARACAKRLATSEDGEAKA
jgi:hypothetical protein